MSNSILEQKLFIIDFHWEGSGSLIRPSETGKLNYAELIEQAAHQQIEDYTFLKGEKKFFQEEVYALPRVTISYKEAQELNLLHLFKESGHKHIEIHFDRKWLLKQALWQVGLKDGGYFVSAVITTPETDFLKLASEHADKIMKRNCSTVYIVPPAYQTSND